MSETNRNGLAKGALEDLSANDEEGERSLASVEEQLRKEMTIYEVCTALLAVADPFFFSPSFLNINRSLVGHGRLPLRPHPVSGHLALEPGVSLSSMARGYLPSPANRCSHWRSQVKSHEACQGPPLE